MCSLNILTASPAGLCRVPDFSSRGHTVFLARRVWSYVSPGEGTKCFILGDENFIITSLFHSMPSTFHAHFTRNKPVWFDLIILYFALGLHMFVRASSWISSLTLFSIYIFLKYLPDDRSEQNTGAVGQRCDDWLGQHDCRQHSSAKTEQHGAEPAG